MIGYVDLTIATFEELIFDRRREPFGSILVRRGGLCEPNPDTCRADLRILLANAGGAVDLMAGEDLVAEWGGRTYDVRVGHAWDMRFEGVCADRRGRNENFDWRGPESEWGRIELLLMRRR